MSSPCPALLHQAWKEQQNLAAAMEGVAPPRWTPSSIGADFSGENYAAAYAAAMAATTAKAAQDPPEEEEMTEAR